jgi:sigma-B regulation protein RsbU (phosphoserine phosphatase)
MVESLQSVLVPRALPDADGVGFAARYHAAGPSQGVGGDFYDVFEIADHRWGVLVGDVCGRGPDAAALTGLVRHSIRAAAVRDPRPLQVLAQTNDAVIDQIDDFRFCTATYAMVERASGGVVARLASAGHPRPVVLRAGQPPELVACSGVLLGVVRRPELVEIDVHLAPGDALVLYTDGVTEARGVDGLFGEERLVEVLGAATGGSAEEIASALEAAVGAHRRSGTDDLAILVVQATGAPDDHTTGQDAVPSGRGRSSEGPWAERV